MIFSVFIPYIKRLEEILEVLDEKYFTFIGTSTIFNLLNDKSMNVS